MSAKISVNFVCKSLSVHVQEYADSEPTYGSGSWLPRGFRNRAEIEAEIERVFAAVGFLRRHNSEFREYSSPLAHACGRWLGTHRQMFEALDGFGTPGGYEGALCSASRLLPDAWFEKFEASTPREKWKTDRPLYFGLPAA